MNNRLYDYWPIVDRPPIEWPDGKALAFYVGLNIEHYELGKPSTSIAPVTAGLPVDPMNHGWRDYGTRVGIWRLIELLDQFEIRASAITNSDVCREYPQIVSAGRDRDWAWITHGKNNSNLWTGLSIEEERAALAELVAEVSESTGKRPQGWLGPALTETENTPALLAELGLSYVLDWCADDQPFPLNVDGARFISVPYAVELNDISLCLNLSLDGEAFSRAVVDHFDVLHEEAQRRPGAVMALSLHPFVTSQPLRHRHVQRALDYVRGHDDVWVTTSDDIAEWYLAHHYDAALEALSATRSAHV
jgi:peptidoglycan/xylan/chitin deacetylase (PgdA/CDA1 family)